MYRSPSHLRYHVVVCCVHFYNPINHCIKCQSHARTSVSLSPISYCAEMARPVSLCVHLCTCQLTERSQAADDTRSAASCNGIQLHQNEHK